MFNIFTQKKYIIDQLSNILKNKRGVKELVFLCIGSPEVSIDLVGPLFGSMMKQFLLLNFITDIHVYGTVSNPVIGMNLFEKIDLVNRKHPDAYIVVVDACVGNNGGLTDYKFGEIYIEDKPIHPGGYLNKGLPPVGDANIKVFTHNGNVSNLDLMNEEIDVKQLKKVLKILIVEICSHFTNTNTNYFKFISKII